MVIALFVNSSELMITDPKFLFIKSKHVSFKYLIPNGSSNPVKTKLMRSNTLIWGIINQNKVIHFQDEEGYCEGKTKLHANGLYNFEPNEKSNESDIPKHDSCSQRKFNEIPKIAKRGPTEP